MTALAKSAKTRCGADLSLCLLVVKSCTKLCTRVKMTELRAIGELSGYLRLCHLCLALCSPYAAQSWCHILRLTLSPHLDCRAWMTHNRR
jgi:hypothetical protein